MIRNLLISGGAGFIGSHFTDLTLQKHPSCQVTVVDALKYSGNLENLAQWKNNNRFRFVKADINKSDQIKKLFSNNEFDAVVNFAAESHVDRSHHHPEDFSLTNIYGVNVLLEQARTHQVKRFVQVSTDEVYGSVKKGSSVENDNLDPRSPYSATKAGGDHLVKSYHTTFGMEVMITRGSNTYGPRQYPEKLIPLMATNALLNLPLPVYGDGKQIRDWLYVVDHCRGIDLVLRKGRAGEIYNIGGDNLRKNLEIVHKVLNVTAADHNLIRHVADRLGHDLRYNISSQKIKKELGWEPKQNFTTGLVETIEWYKTNKKWWSKIRSSKAFSDFYKSHYEKILSKP